MIASAIGVRPRADGVVSKKPRGLSVDIMADRFLVVRFDDGNPVATPHSTSADAFDRAKELFQEHGPDVEVEIHLNQVGSILFNKNSMRKWYQSGCPPIQVSRTTN